MQAMPSPLCPLVVVGCVTLSLLRHQQSCEFGAEYDRLVEWRAWLVPSPAQSLLGCGESWTSTLWSLMASLGPAVPTQRET